MGGEGKQDGGVHVTTVRPVPDGTETAAELAKIAKELAEAGGELAVDVGKGMARMTLLTIRTKDTKLPKEKPL